MVHDLSNEQRLPLIWLTANFTSVFLKQISNPLQEDDTLVTSQACTSEVDR